MRTFIYRGVAVAALALASSAAFAQGQIIIQNINAPGVGFNDPTPAAPVGGNNGATLGQQRLNVFEFAANIWEAVLQPKVDIKKKSISFRITRTKYTKQLLNDFLSAM